MISLPTDLPRQYRYKVSASLRHGTWDRVYELVGARGAMSLHVSGPHRYDDRDNWSAGLESHYRAPPDYMSNDPPSHDVCWLLKAPCWHDGTSLYAQEEYLPLVLAGEHDRVLRRMVRDADERFAIKCEDAA